MAERIVELEKRIRQANREYWSMNSPSISDQEYDRLVEELKTLDPENELIRQVNAPEVRGEKVWHRTPMLSLDKVYDEKDLFKWVQEKSRTGDEMFFVQPKYDGISAKLEGGVLATRGDGHEGTDITSRLPLVRIVSDKRDGILGELIIDNASFLSDFPKYRTKSGQPFKNQRNAVAGIMGCDDVDFYARQGLKVSLIDYDVHSSPVRSVDFPSRWKKIVEDLKKLPYPMDGIVVKLADRRYSKLLGATEHHPRGQIAFKFSNRSRVARLLDIEISQGKEQLSAVGVVEPMDFEGATVTRVKLPLTQNQEKPTLPYVLNGGIAIGDLVEVERSGDVIPNVVAVSQGLDRRTISLNVCPFCGAPLYITDTMVCCTSESCLEKHVCRLEFSLESLGILGAGKTMLRKIMEKTGVRDICGFMRLSEKELAESGIGDGNAANIYREKESKRKNRAENVLTALNVPSLGIAASKLLLANFSMEEILSSLTMEKIMAIRGIGEKKAGDIVCGIDKNRARILKTVAEFSIEGSQQKSRGSVCFTGKVSRPRSEMEKLAMEKGFAPVDSVSKGLAYLVCGEKAGSKLEKAKKLGIPVISEEEFNRL